MSFPERSKQMYDVIIFRQYIGINICNDRPFCVIILRGYGVAGRYIVVLGHSDRMFGCLGNLVRRLPLRRWLQAGPRGGESVCLGRSSEHDVLSIYVSLLSYSVNCRNYQYYTVCDIYMCCNMDLTMYSYIFEDFVINPRGDKC